MDIKLLVQSTITGHISKGVWVAKAIAGGELYVSRQNLPLNKFYKIMSSKKSEEKLYPIVKEVLEKDPYNYICSNPEAKWEFLNVGIDDLRADVVGFKDVGNVRQSKLEIIAVEVKPKWPKYREASFDQSKGYSKFAHKCFLAAPREFYGKEIERAISKGVGLFQIDIKKRGLKMICPAQEMSPDESKVIQLMRNLGYYRCTICDCYWNVELVKQYGGEKYHPQHHFTSAGTGHKEFKKFICPECIKKLSELILPPGGTKGEYLKFFEDLLNRFKVKLPHVTQRKALPLPWCSIPLGLSGVNLDWQISKRVLSVNLDMEREKDDNKKIFRYFKQREQKLKRELGKDLDFNPHWRKKGWTRISKEKKYNPDSKKEVEEIKNWGLKTMIKFYKFFKPHIDFLSKEYFK